MNLVRRILANQRTAADGVERRFPQGTDDAPDNDLNPTGNVEDPSRVGDPNEKTTERLIEQNIGKTPDGEQSIEFIRQARQKEIEKIAAAHVEARKASIELHQRRLLEAGHGPRVAECGHQVGSCRCSQKAHMGIELLPQKVKGKCNNCGGNAGKPYSLRRFAQSASPASADLPQAGNYVGPTDNVTRQREYGFPTKDSADEYPPNDLAGNANARKDDEKIIAGLVRNFLHFAVSRLGKELANRNKSIKAWNNWSLHSIAHSPNKLVRIYQLLQARIRLAQFGFAFAGPNQDGSSPKGDYSLDVERMNDFLGQDYSENEVQDKCRLPIPQSQQDMPTAFNNDPKRKDLGYEPPQLKAIDDYKEDAKRVGTVFYTGDPTMPGDERMPEDKKSVGEQGEENEKKKQDDQVGYPQRVPKTGPVTS